METLGIPCDHIIAVFLHLDITEMSASVVFERWSKDACSRVRAFMKKGSFCWDSMVTCRNWILNDLYRELCVLASTQMDDFVDKGKRLSASGEGADPLVSFTIEDYIRDPQFLRHHKRRKFGVGRQPSTKGVKRCGICRAAKEVSVTKIMIIRNVKATYLRHQIALEGATHGHPVDDPNGRGLTTVIYTSIKS
ncbi:hypothetical protein Ahy_B03g065989 [Arachis hypogaea]|uniref:Protein FAR1-RELATED SEQUENCE n=1 Tax=Arachis hypogaea TaxID=3818 RepID=A0A445A2U2_ARAHY|nr:hypothetical protein Ahy_B03g065989 [Arachis hypogaea]